MARRRFVRYFGNQLGPVVGGTNYRVRFYLAGTRNAAVAYLDSASAEVLAQPLSPNSGQSTTLELAAAAGATQITVKSTTSFRRGDVIPLDGGGNREMRKIKTVTSATVLELDAAITTVGGFAIGAAVGGPEMEGHLEVWLDDQNDYDYTIETFTALKEGPPDGIAVKVTATEIQDEGVTVSTRTRLNFMGGSVNVVDNPGQSRADITIAAAVTEDDVKKWSLIG